MNQIFPRVSERPAMRLSRIAKRLGGNVATGFILGCAVLSLAGCGHKGQAQAKQKTRIIEQSSSGEVIHVAPSTAKRFKLVRATTIERASHFSAPGVIAPDVSRTVSVFSLANGFAVRVPVQLGQQVYKGELLAVVDSPDLAKAISSYQTAKAQASLTSKELAREQELYKHGAAPRKELESAQYSEQRAEIEVDNSQRQIQLLGGSVNSPSPLVNVRAPIGGTIIKQKISRGEAVENSYLFRIADLSRLWVLCGIYENDLSRVQVGDSARIKIAAYPKLKLFGRISNISGVLNAATRTAKVRVVLNNPDGLLKPGMFATARFASTRKSKDVLVPMTALFQLHDDFWVFRPLKAGVYRREPVTIGSEAEPGEQIVKSGLRAGQQVVANALEFAAAVSTQK
jgi:cobalt-zinc-cadmium efflux system membrane fusion protein